MWLEVFLATLGYLCVIAAYVGVSAGPFVSLAVTYATV